MLDKKWDVVYFSSIDWAFNWQGQQQIALTLARQGHRVLYVENTGVRRPQFKDFSRLKNRVRNWFKGQYGFREIEKNLYVYSPILFPFPYSHLALRINKFLLWHYLKRWCQFMRFKDLFVWAFLPTAIIQEMTARFDPNFTVYYYTDDFSESSRLARKIKLCEGEALKRADVIFCHSQKGLEFCRQFNNHVYLMPYGVDISIFCSKKSHAKPLDIAHIKTPIVGYVGGLHKWIDFDLLYELILKNQHVSFIFVGPKQADIKRFESFKNIIFTGPKPREELPLYIENFDVCLIPYKLTSYTESVYPAKLNEYLAMGKPVISTPIREIIRFNEDFNNAVSVAVTSEEFSKVIGNFTNAKESSNSSFFEEVAHKNSWENRIHVMQDIIIEKLLEKNMNYKRSFAQGFKTFYYWYFRKPLYILLCLAMTWFGLFHSSFPWYLAQSLTVKDSLSFSSDVVLVLGGGVGESGEAGEGYQERTLEAVDLYHQGLARKIIFSSGYTYLLKEAEIMKDLALSLGVASQDIFIEDKARNTFENVKFSKGILEKNRFKKVIILSSPYHLKRAQLVARKVLTNMTFTVHPVKYSRFYSSLQTNPTLKQYKALLHEIAAIIAYKFKGYI